MKKLGKFKLTSNFKKYLDILLSYKSYAALTKDDKLVHLNDLMFDFDYCPIALWDNVEIKVVMCDGRDYNGNLYPLDRYTPIGIEVIPNGHMKDGKSRLISLKAMRWDTPMVGGDIQDLHWGLNDVSIEDYNSKNYLPCINQENSFDFGDIQAIYRWIDITDQTNTIYFPSDYFSNLKNPFTPNQYYLYRSSIYEYCPSPYNEKMRQNEIYYSEENESSVLLDFDGKEKTEQILNQLNKNIGNENWKIGVTIENLTGTVYAPVSQCCWMYCVKEDFKENSVFGQGCWHLPSISEIVYALARRNAVDNSIRQIRNVQLDNALYLTNNFYWTANSTSNNNAYSLSFRYGRLNLAAERQHVGYVRAFLTI